MASIRIACVLCLLLRFVMAAFQTLRPGEELKGPEDFFVPSAEVSSKASRRLKAAHHIPYTMATGKEALLELFGGYAANDANLNRWGNESARVWGSSERAALREVLIAMNVRVEESDNNPCAWELVHCYRGDDVALYAIFADGLGYGGFLHQSVSQLKGLRLLKVARHELGGTLPSQFGDLSQLELISLSVNRIEGVFPKELANCHKLFWFEVPRNKFTTEVPVEWYRGWPELVWFTFYGNDGISGRAVPPEIRHWKKLEIVGISRTRIGGEIAQELGELTAMVGWWQSSTDVRGSIPAGTFGNMKVMGTLELDENNLSGPIPADMLSLPSLTALKANDNHFVGSLVVNSSYGPFLPNIASIALNSNMLSGPIPNTSACQSLITLVLSDNQFEETSGMTPSIKTLNVRNNRIKEFPSAWGDLPHIETLDLSNNQISNWPLRGVLEPIGWNYVGFNGCPANLPISPRFAWKRLKSLFVTGNPLNLNIRDFLHSLGYLPLLAKLEASRCNLYGDLPMEMADFIPTHDSLGDEKCVGRSVPNTGFQALLKLVLSYNDITGIRAFPPPILTFADVSHNHLSVLHDAWWNGDGSFQLNDLLASGNPSLHAPVLSQSECPLSRTHCPLSSNEATPYMANGSGFCPDGIAKAPCPMKTCLILNPTRFKTDPDHIAEGYECTTLCRVGTGYNVGSSLNSSMLCRCQVGFGGRDKNCAVCLANTFSTFDDSYNLISSCSPCPANSNTFGRIGQGDSEGCICNKGFYKVLLPEGGFICKSCPRGSTTPDSFLSTGASTIWACQCAMGFFAESNTSAGELDSFLCKRCPAFSNTTSEGATKPNACQCKDGVVRYGLSCGCGDGTFMNHAVGRCDACTGGQGCSWKNDVDLSLLPPDILSGFWAETYQVHKLSAFSGHNVYRCFSKSTCKGTLNGSVECAVGRHGKACSLCLPGKFGGFNGECRDCDVTPGWYILRYVICALLIVLILVLGNTISKDRRAKSSTRKWHVLKVACRQLIKYFQMLGILANFEVQWPKVVRDIFGAVGSVSLNFNSVLGVSCIFREHTLWHDMVFRWVLPFIFLCLCVVAAFASLPLSFIFRKLPSWRMQTFSLKIRFHSGDSLQVAQQLALLFFSSLMQNGFIPLNCASGPNQVSTIVGYPHIECYSSDWWKYFFPTTAYIVLFGPGFICLVFWMSRQVLISVGENVSISSADGDMRRGTYTFVSEGFRDSCAQWGGYVLLRDFFVNVFGCAFASNGMAQLVLSASVFLLFTIAVIVRSPYTCLSNSVMECWINMSLFVICFASSSMGFQSTTDLPDMSSFFSEGESDPAYRMRVSWLFAVAVLSLIGAAGIFICQCLSLLHTKQKLHPLLSKLLPAAIKGMSGDQRKAFERQYADGLSSKGAISKIVRKFDDVEFGSFHHLMLCSPSTLGIIQSKEYQNANVMRRAYTSSHAKKPSAIVEDSDECNSEQTDEPDSTIRDSSVTDEWKDTGNENAGTLVDL